MAQAEVFQSTLQLILDDGIEASTGKQLFKQKSFNNVKTTATADQLFAIALAVAPLQQRPLYNVEREDSAEIQG